MPRRRAEDARLMVFTDHRIVRRPAPAREAGFEIESVYQGPVELLYPADLPASPLRRLYLAAAQVKDFANLSAGIPALEKAIAEVQPPEAEFWFDLAEAYWKTGRLDRAVELYGQAIQRKPGLGRAWHNLAEVLLSRGEVARALEVLEKAPPEPEILALLGVAYAQTGRMTDSLRLLKRAVESDPDLPAGWLNLGVAHERSGDLAAAEAAFRSAILLQPDFPAAHEYLANLLEGAGRREESAFHRARAK
jgi:tetratricopeptide (TPR) repeat protein